MILSNTRFKKFGFIIGFALILIGIIPIVILIFVTIINLNSSFEMVERETLASDITIVNNLVNTEVTALDQIVVDYAIWDDTYAAINTHDHLFYEENIQSWLPDNYNIDLIIVSDLNNTAIGTYNIEETDIETWSQELNIPKGLKDETLPRTGLKKFNNAIYLFAYSPTLMTDYSKTPNGFIILGKKISADFIDGLNQQLGYDLFISFDDQLISNFAVDEEYQEELFSNIDGDNIVYNTFDNYTYAKTKLKNINGEAIGTIGIKKSRSLYTGFINLLHKNGLVSMAFAMVLCIALSVLLTRLIVAPLSKFENEITKMTKNHKISHINSYGVVELQKLANAFNLMADKLFNEKIENKILKETTNRDGLTGLYNHRYFHEHLGKLIVNSTNDIALMFCDIDKFKAVNDTFGHTKGDLVLIDIAKAITNLLPKKSDVFRYGGEEFVVVLPDTNEEEAFKLAEKIRTYIDKNISIDENYHYVPITLSIGLSLYPADAVTLQDLVDKADSAMYYSKQSGRNQCHRYVASMEEFLLQNSELFARQEVLINSAFALAAAIDVKDVYTGKHSELVTKYALLLGDRLGLSPKDKQFLRIGALLHDSGKIGIPDSIINKPTKLTKEEKDIIKNHTIFGHNIVRHIVKTPSIMSCVRNHHERWDGMGYPDGLKGEEIPLFARIVCIVDTFHAMISDRPYRNALTLPEAYDELRANAGTQFDPGLVEAFIETIEASSLGNTTTIELSSNMEHIVNPLFSNTLF